MRSTFRSIWALVAALAAPAPALAWGDEGHRIVGLIAEPMLLPAVRAKVGALLAADAGDTLTAPDFVSRTTWAGRRRADTELAGPAPDAACLGPPAPNGQPAGAGPAQDCAVDAVEQFAAELADPAQPQAGRILALKVLLHLVGDLHQPLHTADDHDRDARDVTVLVYGQARAEPLSRYWNTDVVERLGRDPQAVATEILTGAENEAAEWSAGTPRDWARESSAVARDVAFRLPKATAVDAAGTRAIRLDIDYQIAATEAARQQLGKAGVRLAALLNQALR